MSFLFNNFITMCNPSTLPATANINNAFFKIFNVTESLPFDPTAASPKHYMANKNDSIKENIEIGSKGNSKSKLIVITDRKRTKNNNNKNHKPV